MWPAKPFAEKLSTKDTASAVPPWARLMRASAAEVLLSSECKVFPRFSRAAMSHQSDVLYQGTTLVGPLTTSEAGLQPLGFLLVPAKKAPGVQRISEQAFRVGCAVSRG